MRNSQNHKKASNLFFGGCDYDNIPDLAGAKQGFYRDAKNMRLLTGKNAIKRIYGETLKYHTLAKDWTCIGAVEVNNNVVEVWVSDNNVTVRFRVNGVVMVETTTAKIGFAKTRKLQMSVANDCQEGLFFMTDFDAVPYIFSLTDITTNYANGTTKYTTLFDPALYSVNLQAYNNIPVFRKLITGSLTVGKYAYALRYVDNDGNRTKISLPTPMIPVPRYYKKGSNAHAYNSTHGGNTAAGTTVSPYGIRLQFRVNNDLNYSYIEIIRIRVNSEQALNETPIAEYTPIVTPLQQGEISVRTFDDDGSLDTASQWIPLTDEEETDTMAAIETCKSIRYYNNRLVLANVKLVSKELSGLEFENYSNEIAFPFIDNLEEVGYYSPHNSAYKTSYRSGEIYGFGVACLDYQNNVGFVAPIDNGVVNFNNYQFPERRKQCSGATTLLSNTYWKGIPIAADIENETDGIAPGFGCYVHEKFMKRSEKKTYSPRTISGFDPAQSYTPFTPKSYNDTDSTGLDITPNPLVARAMDKDTPTAVQPYANNEDFSIDYYAMGIAIAGVSNLPDWVTSFAIVRTKPAGRVVCQGITAYKMTDSPQSKNNILLNGYTAIKKSLDEVCFYSDEIKQAYIGAYTDNFLTNRNYKFKPVSPLGFFSEVYSGRNDNISGTFMHYTGLDAILYARNLGNKQPTGLTNYENASLYFTKFGVWRNDVTDAVSGTTTYGINADENENFKGVGFDGYVKITLDDDIYKHQSPASLTILNNILDSINQTTKNWHEPFYVANVIDESKEIPDINQQEYVLTGHYQKIRSKIGEGNDQEQSFELVDERFDDCCVNRYYANRDTYLYIKDGVTGEEKAWLDVTIDPSGTFYTGRTQAWLNAVYASFNSVGYYNSTDPITGVITQCFGIYTHTWSSTNVETGNATIEFREDNNIAKEFCIPAGGTEIIVKYDTRFPLKVFGGDTVIGESCFALVDGNSDPNGDVANDKQLYAWVGLPYSGYYLSKAVDLATNTSSLQGGQFIASNVYRQIIVSAVVESPVHLPYSAQQSSTTTYNRANNFPRVNYILRPIRWDNSTINNNFSSGGGGINEQYKTDYPDEYKYWHRGGFRSLQPNNLDYSKGNNYNKYFSKPLVGFEEKTDFCTRNMWSLRRNPNVQDDPNLKTFLTTNIFDISDAYGEIKYLYDTDSGKGNNLIAITEKGICLLITDKRQISDINSNELFVLDSDRFIKGEYWLSRDIGCNDEMWRGIAEYNNTIFIPNSESVYRMAGLELKDVLRFNEGSYYERLHPQLQQATNNTPITGVYDVSNNEYWIYIGAAELVSPYDGTETIGGVDSSILTPKKLNFGGIVDSEIIPRQDIPKTYTGETFVFKNDKNVWTGSFDYKGDKFLAVAGLNTAKKQQVLIFRNYETYEAGTGTQVNGANVDGRVQFVIAPEGSLFKEFIDGTINATLQPVKIELTNVVGSVEATQTYTKDYGRAWYYMTPRKATNKLRFQGRFMIAEIYNDTTGEYEVISTEHGYKIIR